MMSVGCRKPVASDGYSKCGSRQTQGPDDAPRKPSMFRKWPTDTVAVRFAPSGTILVESGVTGL